MSRYLLADIGPEAEPATIPNPASGSRWQVSFKCEDFETDGTMVGPVWIVDLDRYEADPEIVATMITLPFGYTPDGETMPGWVTKREALRIAALYGVDLGES
jgi:hypothetical protein